MWQQLSREWLKALEVSMVEYRKWENTCRDYMIGFISYREWQENYDTLVANGASPTKLGDIYVRVSKEYHRNGGIRV